MVAFFPLVSVQFVYARSMVDHGICNDSGVAIGRPCRELGQISTWLLIHSLHHLFRIAQAGRGPVRKRLCQSPQIISTKLHFQRGHILL